MRRNLSLILLAALCFTGCQALDDYMDSSKGPEGTAAATSGKQSQKPASRPAASQRPAQKSLEEEGKETQSVPAASQTDSIAAGNPEAGADSGETAALENAAAGDNAVIDIETHSVAEAPVYVEGVDSLSNLKSNCDPALNNKAWFEAENLGRELSRRLTAETGEIYAAPTVVPDEYLDCVPDCAPKVLKGLLSKGQFTAARSSSNVFQNVGSATLIPALVRECRQQEIPYLAVSVVRKVGGRLRLTLRILRVKDGITLAQSYKALE